MNLDFSTVKNVGLGVLIAIVVIGVVVAVIVKNILGKIVTILIAALLLGFGWQQRQKVIDFVDSAGSSSKAAYCDLYPTFFGIRVDMPGCP